MFRLQNNVPEVYVQESRDFQLFCRLFDSILGGLKYSVDSLLKSTDTSKCSTQLFDLLKLKLGVFKDINLGNDELRILLSAFPVLIRYKGSLQGLQYCVNILQRLTKSITSSIGIQIDNNNYTIEILVQEEEFLHNSLFKLFNLIIPTGYEFKTSVVHSLNSTSYISINDSVRIFPNAGNIVLASNITSEGDYPQDADDLSSAVGLSIVSNQANEDFLGKAGEGDT